MGFPMETMLPIRSARLPKRQRIAVNLAARVDRYGRLAEWNKRLSVFLLISLCGHIALVAAFGSLWRGYEIRTGYFALAGDTFLALGQAQDFDFAARDERFIRSFIEAFVTGAFRVSTDLKILRSDHDSAGYKTMGAARSRMNAFFKERQALDLQKSGGSIEIGKPSILQVAGSANTFLVSLVEREWAKGRPSAARKIDLTVNLSLEPDEKTAEEAKQGYNQYYMWIRDIHFQVREIGLEEAQDILSNKRSI